MTLQRFHLAGPLLLVAIFLGCDGADPLPPTMPGISEATSGASGNAPSNASATAVSESRIDVSWQDNSSNETGFEIHRSTSGPAGSFTLWARTGANVTGFSDAGLTPLIEYCYKVRAFRVTGRTTSYSPFATVACATTPAPPAPAAPSGMDAMPIGSSAVGMQWVDNSTDEGGFRVERSLDLGSTWTTTGVVGPNVTSSFDGGLASEQQVCYRVIAFNGSGDSPPSNTGCTTPPAGPTNLAVTGVDQQTIDLAWTDNSAMEDGYEVWVFFVGELVDRVSLPPNSTNFRLTGSHLYSFTYVVYGTKDGGFSDSSSQAVPTMPPAGDCVPTSATELCDNGVDDDCNGLTDSFDPECVLSCWGGCPEGYVCGADGLCVAHCNDGVQDGNEGDVDCGGSCDAKCAAGQTCWVNADCASGICDYGICQAIPGGQP